MTKAKTRTIMVPIEKLEVCPHNPRKRELGINELVKSIKKTELKEVIEVHPHNDKWHVMAGQRSIRRSYTKSTKKDNS